MNLSNFATRVLSASLLAPIALAAIYCGGIAYCSLIFMAFIISIFEFKNIVLNKYNNVKNKVFLCWMGFGFFYTAIPCAALILIRNSAPPLGLVWTLWLFLSVWATDIGGYIFGRLIGGPKLIPTISPKKTWSGLMGAILLSVVFSALFSAYLDRLHQGLDGYTAADLVALVFAGAGLAIIAQAGDLFESWIKRRFGVKDSGTIIPGHGGVLDRIDGLLFAAPAALLFLWCFDYL